MTQLDFTAWIGTTQTRDDNLDAARATALQAALGMAAEPLCDGAALPPLWHWLYFWDVRPPAQLSQDGHIARGGFLPPVPFPRRMWAGSRLTFNKPAILGVATRLHSRIKTIEHKHGKTGALVFVTIAHELTSSGDTLVTEAQDIVYRDMPTALAAPASAAPPPATPAAWQEAFDPDTVLLFRYSALTMNSHRIHYDATYARETEHYPGLVVHAPLLATLLMGFAARHAERPIATFGFRGIAALFCGPGARICGNPRPDGVSVWIEDADGRLCMSANADY